MSSNDEEIGVRVTATDELTPQLSKLNAGILSHTANLKAAAEEYNVVGERASESMGKLSLATSGVSQELIRLGHEAMTGNFSRMPGSLLVLESRMGGLNLATLAWTAGIGGTLAVLYEMAKSAEDAADGVAHINNAFEMSGRSFEFSQEQISKQVTQLHELPGVSMAAAQSMEADLGRSARLTAADVQYLIEHVQAFARAQNTDIPSAMKELSAAIEDPLQSYKKLDDQYNILTVSQRAQMNAFAESHQTIAAHNMLLDALSKRLSTVQDHSTPLEKSVNMLKKAWDDFISSLGNSGIITTVNAALAGMLMMVTKVADAIGGFDKKMATGGPQYESLIKDGKIDTTETPKAPPPDQQNAKSVADQDNDKQKQIQAKAALDYNRSLNDQDISETRRVNEEKFSIQAEYIKLAADEGKITHEQEYQELEENLRKETESNQKSFEEQMSLWAKGSKEFQRIQNEMVLAKEQADLKMAKLEKQRVDTENADLKRSEAQWDKMLNSINGAFAKSFTDMLSGTRTWAQTFQAVSRSAFEDFIKDCLKKSEQWARSELIDTATTRANSAARQSTSDQENESFIMFCLQRVAKWISSELGITAATVAGNGVQNAMAMQTIATDAAEASAGAYAATAAIPIVGPALAPAAATEAYMSVIAMEAMVPAESGAWSVKEGAYHLHDDETVLPRGSATAFRQNAADSLLNGGGGGAQVPDLHMHVHALDSKDFQKYLGQHAKTVAKVFQDHLRSGGSRSSLARG